MTKTSTSSAITPKQIAILADPHERMAKAYRLATDANVADPENPIAAQLQRNDFADVWASGVSQAIKTNDKSKVAREKLEQVLSAHSAQSYIGIQAQRLKLVYGAQG